MMEVQNSASVAEVQSSTGGGWEDSLSMAEEQNSACGRPKCRILPGGMGGFPFSGGRAEFCFNGRSAELKCRIPPRWDRVGGEKQNSARVNNYGILWNSAE